MKKTIEAWIDHHFPISESEVNNLERLYSLIHSGRIWWKEDDKHDQKILITIEIED